MSSSCLLCSGARHRPLKSLTELTRPPFAGEIVQCTDCGLARLSPLPTETELLQFYSGDAYLESFADAGVSMVAEEPETLAYLESRLAALEQQLGMPAKILDVGASTGSFLALARQRGWTIEGIELGDTGVELARRRHNITVHHCAIENAPFLDSAFDVVHASHVLEHVRDPNQFLTHVRRLLKPGGVAVVEVPSELGDLFTWFQSRVLRRRLEPYRVPSPHLYFFTPRTLTRLFRNHGFEVTLLKTPRRNKSSDSRMPMGAFVKRGLYRVESSLLQGPLIEIYARK